MILASLLAATLAACTGATSGEAPVATTHQTLSDPALQQLATKSAAGLAASLPAGGVVVAVFHGDSLAIASAGMQPDGTPLPANGAWRIASVTKPFMATLTLRAAAEGLVRLDAPVADYVDMDIPEDITIADLLRHTSGIFNYVEDPTIRNELIADLDRVWQPETLVDLALEQTQFNGTHEFSYSNTNYLLIGMILEAVTGDSAADLLQDAIVEPLGLDATYLTMPNRSDQEPKPVPAFSQYVPNAMAPDGDFVFPAVVSSEWTAGAMVSDGDDLATFVRAVFDGRLLDDASLNAMTDLAPGTHYGLGLARNPEVRTPVWGHTGETIGYVTELLYAPSVDRGVVIGFTTDDLPEDSESDALEVMRDLLKL